MEEYAEFAARLADSARAETLPRWASAGEARNKAEPGSFDPVTEADVAAEQAMRRLIEAEHPDHGISGEEFSDRASQGAYSWSLDPIDGTRSFVCGMPTWVTLIGLLEHGAPVLGVIDAPRIGERYVGYGDTAYVTTTDGRAPLRTSSCSIMSDARFSSTDPFLFRGAEANAFAAVHRQVKTTRFGHDGYAYARLAAGSIDLIVESGLQPYDINALVPVVRAAGGQVGNWQGGEDLRAGQIVAAATTDLFEAAVGLLKVAAR